MGQLLKRIPIKKTKKVHECNASIWLRESALSEIRCGNLPLTISERRSVIKAKQNNWKIPEGSSCIYETGIYNGEFFAFYCIPEIDDICQKYDIYEEY